MSDADKSALWIIIGALVTGGAVSLHCWGLAAAVYLIVLALIAEYHAEESRR
jgi:hypothetical protein